MQLIICILLLMPLMVLLLLIKFKSEINSIYNA
uniref:Uncharacterized protein n=1 Tax=Anguilla anguilla TaxID=7936 RepID=A0A0E9V4M3_ANGAN